MDGTAKPALDPGRFSVRAEDSWTLPSEWYFSPEVYRAEHEAIFYRSWTYQCHESQLPQPGDYYAGHVMDQGVLLVRGADGEVRGFYNVCSHRAHPLAEPGCGHAKLIVCPYHQWCYTPEGSFRGARGRETLKDWIPENADLKPVRVESFGGLLFVNLDPQARQMAKVAGKLLADMRAACPSLDRLVLAESFTRDVAANWKAVIDNNHECYHCAVNHKTLLQIVAYEGEAAWSDDGITFSHKVARMKADEVAYARKGDRIDQESLFGFVFPTTIPLMFPGSPSLALFQVIPTGPETTRERWDFYFSAATPTDQERRFVNYIKEVLIPEDVGLCERVQQGLHSRGYRQGRFVVSREHPEFSEHHVHFFQRMVHDALMGA
jgi:choline monooxygenase